MDKGSVSVKLQMPYRLTSVCCEFYSSLVFFSLNSVIECHRKLKCNYFVLVLSPDARFVFMSSFVQNLS